MKRKIFTILFLIAAASIFFPHRIIAQEHLAFKPLSYREGLIQSPISTMLQDKRGFVWVGSWSGLERYDGSVFKNFRQNDTISTAISHNRINKIYQDEKDNIWICTGGGLNLYNPLTETFKRIGMVPGKGGGNYIAAMCGDSQGTLWVSTFKGLKYVSANHDQLEMVAAWKHAGELEVYQGVSFSLLEDQKKTMWVGVKQGLKRFDPKTRKILELPDLLKKDQQLSRSKIVVIRQDASGDIWFGTEENGVLRFNEKNNTRLWYQYNATNSNRLPSNWINDILIRHGKVWIATRKGLSVLDPETESFTNYNHDSADPLSLIDDAVWSLMEDETGNVWIATYTGEINIYYPGILNFTNIGERVGNNIGLNKKIASAIVEDNDGGLWIATFGGGLNYINRTKRIAKYYPVTDPGKGKISNEVKSILKHPNGKLWLGTLDGLGVFDIRTESIRYIDLEVVNAKLTAKLINAMVIDNDGVWVGTNGGGLRFLTFDGRETRSFISLPNAPDGLSDNYINALLKDGDNLWIATQNGLNVLNTNTNTFTLLKRKNSIGLGNNNVLALFRDSKGRIWTGTDGGGLNYFDRSFSRIYQIDKSRGLADDVIASIIEDDDSNLWVSTNNGISRIAFLNTNFPLTEKDFKIINYTSANGLAGNQFLINAGMKAKSGEILFGGMNGVTAFHPDRIIQNTSQPKILLRGIQIRNKEISFGKNSPLKAPVNETSEITLPYDNNSISISFSALNFINPERNRYAYNISNSASREEWIDIGNQKEVSFINLKPGQYVFRVKAANNDGVWNTQPRTLTINILPPVWRTWWAYTLYAMIILAITYKVAQFLRIRARLERDLYNEHLQNERQEEFYKLKLEFFTNISHEIRTPLTLILGPVENLYKQTQSDVVLNRQVLLIKNNTERLFRLISELMDFRKAETGNMLLQLQKDNIVPFLHEIFLSFQQLAKTKNIQYEFTSTRDDIVLLADRNQLEKVFFNLLSNAFKFTQDQGTIKFDISVEGEKCVVRITDNGKGIPSGYHEKIFTNFYQVHPDKSQPGTGVGLALAKNIIELHQGSIQVESAPAVFDKNGKTIFIVSIPLSIVESENARIVPYVLPEEALTGRADEVVRLPESELEKKYCILLAEDNDELRSFIADSLVGYDVITCVNGKEGFEKAIDEIPDLVISDVMMPEMDGLELCRKIKTDDRTSHIPVILLTALGAHIHQVNGLKTGADVYMTKPFSTKLLELNVHNLLLSREVMRKKFAQQITLQPLNIPISSPDEGFIKKLMQIIEDNLENPDFGVVALGDEIGMSKTVLYKKMVSLTDNSPADFIKSMRLKKAAFLLQQNVLNVNEVATLVGFNDAKYFSKEFKKFHGKAPLQMVGKEGQ